jgi:hypothetical protein
MPWDEDQCKSEAVRLLWDSDSLPKLLSEYAKQHGLTVQHVSVFENFSLRDNRLKSIRMQARLCQRGTPDDGGRNRQVKDGRYVIAKMRRFAMRVLLCPPKMSTSRGVVYVDFNVVLPAPVATQE